MGDLETALKESVSALDGAGIPYLVGGSLACWARGGPPATRDVDLVVKPDDADTALAALADAGMRTARPPEQWLYKAWCGDVLVDVIFEPVGLPVDDRLLARGETLNVVGMRIEVMALEDVMTTKLLALGEHALDLEPLVGIARALRERIDWDAVRARTAVSPFARAFLFLVTELGLEPAAPAARPPTRVRVA